MTSSLGAANFIECWYLLTICNYNFGIYCTHPKNKLNLIIEKIAKITNLIEYSNPESIEKACRFSFCILLHTELQIIRLYFRIERKNW